MPFGGRQHVTVIPGELAAVVAAVFSSAGYVSARQAMEEGSGELLVAVTASVSVVLLLPVLAVHGQNPLALPTETIVVFAFSGLLGSCLGRFVLSNAIGLVGPSTTHALKSASPVVAAVLSVTVLDERMTPLLAIGTVVVVAGIAMLTRAAHQDVNSDVGGAVTAAVTLFIVCWFGTTPIVRKYGLSVLDAPIVPALWLNFAAAALVGWAFTARTPGQFSRAVEDGMLRPLVFTGIAWTVAIGAYFTALSLADAVVVVPLFNASPLFTAALSTVFLGSLETVSRETVVGAAIAAVGVTLVTLA